jgi:hypothetical protein
MRRVKGTMKPEQPERRDLCEMSASACEVRRDSLFRYCSASTMPVFLNFTNEAITTSVRSFRKKYLKAFGQLRDWKTRRRF